MPSYRYKARDASGQAITGTISFDSQELVVKHLEERGYFPISIEEATKGTQQNLGFWDRFSRISEKEINFFTRQLVTLTKAGVPLIQALQTLRDQIETKSFKNVLSSLILDLDKGESLSAALSHQPHIFSELYVAMVRVGEATGKLDEILTRVAELGEYEVEIKSKIKAATFYPKMIISIMIMAFLFITTFVLPRFTSFFDQAGVELLITTKFLLWMNYVIRHWWFVAIAVIGTTVFSVKTFLKTPLGKNIWDNVKLSIPVFGKLTLQFAMSRFSRMFSITSRSGVPILDSLEIVSRSVGNVHIAREIMTIRESVRAGQGLAKPMSQSKYFPPIVVRMVAVGEESGKLDELLLNVSEHYDFEVNSVLQRLTVLIEPILLVVLGGMVLFLILSIFMPLLSFYTKLASG